MRADSHELAVLVHDHNVEIHSSVLDLFGAAPDKQPVHALGRQKLLQLEIDHQRWKPEANRNLRVGFGGGRCRGWAGRRRRRRRNVLVWFVLEITGVEIEEMELGLHFLGLEPGSNQRESIAYEPQALLREALSIRETNPLVNRRGRNGGLARHIDLHAV